MSKESDLPSILEDDATIEIPKEDYDKISKAYYDEGMCFGRDALYHYLKTKYGKETPSIRTVMRFLSRQKLHQEFSQTRSGGMTNYFIPVSPFHSLSIDLIDFNFRQSMQYRYILVVLDNFSRKMFCEALTSKKAHITANGMKRIFEQMKKAHGDDILDRIKYINSDDGPEFRGDFDKLLKEYKIPRRRTLGGHPEGNALVERSNAKVKMLIAKYIKIEGGSWKDHLEKATDAYNHQYIRTTKYTPLEALELKPDQYQILIDNVASNQKNDVVIKKDIFQKNDIVRIKLNKGTLGKSSTPSWSSETYKIGEVIRNVNPQIADKYKIEGKAQDQNYSRGDLQKVNGKVEEIPRKLTKKQRDEIASQLRLNQDSEVEGAFNTAQLAKDKAAFEEEFEDDFEEGAEKTEAELRKMRKASIEANKGKKVPVIPREKSTRQRKQVEVFDFTKAGASDEKIRGRKQEFTIEYLMDVKGSGKSREYLVKWKGYQEPTWTSEWYKEGSKWKRNIDLKYVRDFQEATEMLEQEEKLSPTTKLSTMTPTRKRQNTLTSAITDKGVRQGRKLF